MAETLGWTINEFLSYEEYDRVIEQAKEERGRYEEDGKWWNARGPLKKEEEVKSGPWRPGSVKKKDPWEDEAWNELEEEDEQDFILKEIAELCGLST